MKYDTSMTHLHGDVLAAVRLMLYHNTEITKKFSAKDSSPALLREYLRKRYNNSGRGNSEIQFFCKSTGMDITLKRLLNNEGDRELRLSWSQLTIFIRNNWDEVFKDESVPPTVGEPQTAFDYSQLSDFEADKLRSCEQVIKQETVSYFTILGAKFKEAQDLLANHDKGLFESWYTMLGFKRQTVYNLIQRYEFICSSTVGELQNGESLVDGLPLTLSYEISKPGAPPELVQRVLEGDITTNAEYQKVLKELETTRQKLDEVNRENIRVAKQRGDMYEKCAALEAQIAELESRPVDVAVQTIEVIPEGYVSPEEHREALNKAEQRSKKLSDEISRRKFLSNAEKSGKLADKIAELEKELEKQKRETTKAYGKASKAAYESESKEIALEQARKEKADLESKIKALEDNPPEIAQTSDSKIKHFLLNITIEDMEKLIELVENSGMPLISKAVKNARLLKLE